jgi:hypothetical protein
MSEQFDLVVVGGGLGGRLWPSASRSPRVRRKSCNRRSSLRLRLCSGPRTGTDHGVYEITFAEVGQ